MELIKIFNDGTTPFDFMHRNAKKIIRPGESMIVPFDLCATLFGDPRTRDTNGDNARKRIYDKVRAHFGFSPGLQSEGEWLSMKPDLTFVDVETNEPVLMLIDDPFADPTVVSSSPAAVEADNSALDRKFDEQAAQIANLTQIILSMRAEKETPGSSQDNTPTSDNAPAEKDENDATPSGGVGGAASQDEPPAAKKPAAKPVAKK